MHLRQVVDPDHLGDPGELDLVLAVVVADRQHPLAGERDEAGGTGVGETGNIRSNASYADLRVLLQKVQYDF